MLPLGSNEMEMAETSGEGTDKTTVIQRDTSQPSAEQQKAKDTDACLIIIQGTPKGHRFFITQPEMIIGRDPNVAISVSDQSISRKHAQVTKGQGKTVTLTDLGSANGTFVNEKKVNAGEVVTLAKEDMIRLGNSVLKFLPAGELEILFYGDLDTKAHTDPLTRVHNKGYLLEAIESEFKRAKSLKVDFSVIFMDLDFFKKINDTYGHDAGDYVLKEFASLVKSSFLRPKDVFARYGGEEFVLLLAKTNAKIASELGERIRCAVESHAFIYEGKKLPVTSSVGVAEMTDTTPSATELLKAADKALYSAKQGGRNRVVIAPKV